MLKPVLLTVAGIILVMLMYVGWVMSQVAKDIERKVNCTIDIRESSIMIAAVLVGADRNYSVTEIRVPRHWGEAIAIAPPIGFSAQPYALDGETDPDRVAWINEANERLIRWVGGADLIPDEATKLNFSIQSAPEESAKIDFTYETKIGVSGSISSFSVEIKVDEI